MNGLIFLFFLFFFVFPLLKNISKGTRKSTNRYQEIAKRLQEEARNRTQQADHGVTKARKHQQLHRNDSSDVFPEEHEAHVQARYIRDQKEFAKMERTIHSKNNRAMTRVSNKTRDDWGTRGDNGLTSSKSIIIVLLLLLLAYLIFSAVFPELSPRN